MRSLIRPPELAARHMVAHNYSHTGEFRGRPKCADRLHIAAFRQLPGLPTFTAGHGPLFSFDTAQTVDGSRMVLGRDEVC